MPVCSRELESEVLCSEEESKLPVKFRDYQCIELVIKALRMAEITQEKWRHRKKKAGQKWGELT